MNNKTDWIGDDGQHNKIVTRFSKRRLKDHSYHVVLNPIGEGYNTIWEAHLNGSSKIAQGHTVDKAIENLFAYWDALPLWED
jgi:hypothetical protein